VTFEANQKLSQAFHDQRGKTRVKQGLKLLLRYSSTVAFDVQHDTGLTLKC
jgi:hypothetical protein